MEPCTDNFNDWATAVGWMVSVFFISVTIMFTGAAIFLNTLAEGDKKKYEYLKALTKGKGD